MPAIITVTSLADNTTVNTQVTLREAIQAANTDTSVDGSKAGSGTDTIQFAAGLFASPGQTITLGGTQLTIGSAMTINGPGADQLTISGNNASRIIEVVAGNTVTISGLTLTNGYSGIGGGIENSGTLTISHSTISANSAGGNGGGINNSDVSRLRSTIVANNEATGTGDDLNGTFQVEYSLIELRAGATIRETVARSNRFGVDPMLEPLTDNGGPTETHALLPGSPAINRGFYSASQSFDQRGPGFVRTVDRTDIGAYEVQKKGAYLVRDPNHATRRFVIVVGSTANDTITVALVAPNLNVTLNGKLHKFSAANIGGVYVLGDDGNDTLTLTSLPVNVGGIMYGGRGDDVLTGSGGNDILLGGEGDDRLLGLAGADVLIGGEGSDSLTGGNGDDLLIGGSTLYDSQVDKLLAIRNEWTSGGTYETRVQNLSQGLNVNTVFDGYYDELNADTTAGTGGREFLFADENDFLTGVVTSGATVETLIIVVS